jgi:glutaredoxin
MSEPEITVYGAHWCPDCRQSKQFLGEHQIPYNWVDIEEDKEAEEFVIKTNKGKRIIPTITFPDSTFLRSYYRSLHGSGVHRYPGDRTCCLWWTGGWHREIGQYAGVS